MVPDQRLRDAENPRDLGDLESQQLHDPLIHVGETRILDFAASVKRRELAEHSLVEKMLLERRVPLDDIREVDAYGQLQIVRIAALRDQRFESPDRLAVDAARHEGERHRRGREARRPIRIQCANMEHVRFVGQLHPVLDSDVIVRGKLHPVLVATVVPLHSRHARRDQFHGRPVVDSRPADQRIGIAVIQHVPEHAVLPDSLVEHLGRIAPQPRDVVIGQRPLEAVLARLYDVIPRRREVSHDQIAGRLQRRDPALPLSRRAVEGDRIPCQAR